MSYLRTSRAGHFHRVGTALVSGTPITLRLTGQQPELQEVPVGADATVQILFRVAADSGSGSNTWTWVCQLDPFRATLWPIPPGMWGELLPWRPSLASTALPTTAVLQIPARLAHQPIAWTITRAGAGTVALRVDVYADSAHY